MRVDGVKEGRLWFSWREYGAHQSVRMVDQAAGLSLCIVDNGCNRKPLSMRKTHLFRSVSSMRGYEAQCGGTGEGEK